LVAATVAITAEADLDQADLEVQAAALEPAQMETALDQLLNLNIQNMVQLDTDFQEAMDTLHRGVVVVVVALVVEELMQAVTKLAGKVVEAG
jgi:hypothetical protein